MPEESLDVACEFCGRTDPCPCEDREAAGRDHLLVRPDGPPSRERTPKTHGELLVALADARTARNLAREDLRRVSDRIEVLMTHGARWSTEYVAQELRRVYAQIREALS